MMKRLFRLLFPMASPYSTESSLPPWFGFTLGLVAGFAVSAGFVGFVIGMSWGGIGITGSVPVVAQNPPSAPSLPTPEPPAPPSSPVPPVDPKTDHIRGNPNAKISVIEYSDFECPFCKRHHPTMVQMLEANKDDVNWVYRHFPLSFHPSANPAAEGSECAAELGGNDAFWKFTDAVFAADSLTPDMMPGFAKQAGVDEAAFKACVESGRHKQKIQDQMNGGMAAGVQGTPGNIVLVHATKEQRDISGAVPLSNFQTVIDSLLGK
jgi:protein-disulfide isomerase